MSNNFTSSNPRPLQSDGFTNDNVGYCSIHNEPFTNFDSHYEQLKPLCPECIQE